MGTDARRLEQAQSGTARAAVLGISDGLVTNVSLILGVAGANADAPFVRIAGLASLVAGAGSMAVGEYISMQAQRELLERVIADARAELAQGPEQMIDRLTRTMEKNGVDHAAAGEAAKRIAADPQGALDIYIRLGLGVDPKDLGSPIGAAFSSLVTFAIGAAVPLVPWYITSGDTAVVASIVVSAVAALVIGGYLGWETGKGVVRSAIRQVVIVAVAAGITYLVGRIFRVRVT